MGEHGGIRVGCGGSTGHLRVRLVIRNWQFVIEETDKNLCMRN